jgi:hypothetical protein
MLRRIHVGVFLTYLMLLYLIYFLDKLIALSQRYCLYSVEYTIAGDEGAR